MDYAMDMKKYNYQKTDSTSSQTERTHHPRQTSTHTTRQRKNHLFVGRHNDSSSSSCSSHGLHCRSISLHHNNHTSSSSSQDICNVSCTNCLSCISTTLRKHLSSTKIVKTEYNANLDLLGFLHFITFKECSAVP